MLTNRRDVRIVWGDCDPAGIVFYPRYFEMFDTSTTALFERALGMTKFQFVKAYNSVGYPMVDTRARFLLPTRYGDDVVIETTVTEIRRRPGQDQGDAAAARHGGQAVGGVRPPSCGISDWHNHLRSLGQPASGVLRFRSRCRQTLRWLWRHCPGMGRSAWHPGCFSWHV
jgi:YbgC/YbaW family acyl-CoA thioester hydrolase